jgi:hypothetical protein
MVAWAALCAAAPGAFAQEAPAPATLTLGDLEPAKITVDVVDTPLMDVLKLFEQQAGSGPYRLGKGAGNANVTLRLRDVSYWRALDELCALRRLTYLQNEGLLIYPRGPHPDISAYAGPVVIKLESAESDFCLDDLARDRLVGYLFDVFWEGRLPVVEGSIEFTKAVTDRGVEMAPESAAGRLVPGTLHVGKGDRKVYMPHTLQSLRFRNFPEGTKRLAELSGKVSLEAAVGVRRIEIPDALHAEGRAASLDGLALKIVAVETLGRYLCIALACERDGKPETLRAYPEITRYGLKLVHGSGRECPGAGASKTTFTWLKPSARVKALVDAGAPGTHLFIFRDLPQLDGPWSLAYSRPEKTVTAEWPFKFEDLPLP